MSFGYSIGDFITVGQLAWKVSWESISVLFLLCTSPTRRHLIQNYQARTLQDKRR